MSEPIPAHPEAVEEPGPEPEHRLVHFVEWMQSLTPAAGGKEEKTESESDEEGPVSCRSNCMEPANSRH